jgi:hypothetical protein
MKMEKTIMRSFIICALYQYFWADWIREYNMDRACDMHGKSKVHVRF